ncbi:MAG: hypothetical protein ACR2FH_09545 [Caulobacteraceae bacterium]
MLHPAPAVESPPLTAARWLFGIAAAFNVAVGLSLLFLRPSLAPVLHLDPTTGTNLVLIDLVGGLIVLFGYAYARVAADPIRYRPFIHLGVIGKLIAVASAVTHWRAGQVFWALPLLASGDLAFVALFLLFLWRSRAR